jgi:hypothetical protein
LNDNAFFNGTVFTPQVFVKVRWGWIALLASELVLTSLFLVATVAETFSARAPVLKGSSLPTLCILDKEARERLGSVSDIETLRREARRLRATLDVSGSGVVLGTGIQGARTESSRSGGIDQVPFDRESRGLRQDSPVLAHDAFRVGMAS